MADPTTKDHIDEAVERIHDRIDKQAASTRSRITQETKAEWALSILCFAFAGMGYSCENQDALERVEKKLDVIERSLSEMEPISHSTSETLTLDPDTNRANVSVPTSIAESDTKRDFTRPRSEPVPFVPLWAAHLNCSVREDPDPECVDRELSEMRIPANNSKLTPACMRGPHGLRDCTAEDLMLD